MQGSFVETLKNRPSIPFSSQLVEFYEFRELPFSDETLDFVDVVIDTIIEVAKPNDIAAKKNLAIDKSETRQEGGKGDSVLVVVNSPAFAKIQLAGNIVIVVIPFTCFSLPGREVGTNEA